MISTLGLTIQFGAKPLFENVTVKFGDGNRYGLIGANGSGKSTFMKILAGQLTPTAGHVALDSGEKLGWLRQDQFGFEDQIVLDVVMQGDAELWAVKQEKDAIYANPEATEADYMHAAELEGKFAELDGYSAEARAGELLLGVGIPTNKHSGPMQEVAPGWKLRVLLAQALFGNPDILLLDEPTNNLDINTIRWLETVLDQRTSTMIIISHDRHFLNSICTHMADLDYGKIQLFPGNYDEYMQAATQAREGLVSANARAKEKIAELQTFVSRFSANASKARQATSRVKQIDKLKQDMGVIKPSSRQYPYIRFEQEKPLHRNVVEVTDLAIGYDTPLFSKLSFMIEAGDRLAIIGENGVGKSTLIKTLIGELPAKAGTVKWSENAKIGYYGQDHAADFDSDLTLFDWIQQWTQPGDDDQMVRGVLGKLLFSGDDAKKSVRVLSGGEQGRMLFGKLMLSRANVLVLDEPTNHLDMESIESLNTAVELFKGTVIFVSHDRSFVSSLASRVIEITGQGPTVYDGNYEDYLASRGVA
ncbi:ABC-F family ATPase [Sulfuriferula plumbiphila]|uniref:Probable ATP-binding protein YbiT n=1 Tax=Sulfuriferula plumbiphila TaxID=171865 RepID=A0A512L5B3_9PROT|nr:ABC-F family ATPase [Sulfuriferula plumbiphila]BBP05905.1 ABC-F family ATPase [Sulfuriferula plumbiphila]GEP29675.1 ABC-F family ATPase [Sulfuriferula plumbiphila]